MQPLFGKPSLGALALLCSLPHVAFSMNPSRALLQCPEGSAPNEAGTLCTNGTDAFGPFSPEMVNVCIAEGQSRELCEGTRWNAAYAAMVRGEGVCPVGTEYSVERGLCLEGSNVFGPFSRATVARCKENDGGQACADSLRIHESFAPRLNATRFCPDGFSFDSTLQLCVGEEWALGPFPSAMKELCKVAGHTFCDELLLPRAQVWQWRGNGKCPRGTEWDAGLSLCREGDDVFGPFTVAQVKSCLGRKGGWSCLANRWDRSFLPKEQAAGHDAELGLQYARAAERGSVGHSLSQCYAYVWKALVSVAGVPPVEQRPGARCAYEFGVWANGSPELLMSTFRLQRRDQTGLTQWNAPVGSVLVWNRGQCGYSSECGHIEIVARPGYACSDFCGPVSPCGGQKPLIYVPVEAAAP